MPYEIAFLVQAARTATAIVTLALGIGANTAIFSVVEGIELAPLPYAQPDRLVTVRENSLSLKHEMSLSYPDLVDWQRSARSFQQMAPGSAKALGKSITLDGIGYTIIGVLAPEFNFWTGADVYTPLGQGDPLFATDRAFHPGILCRPPKARRNRG